MKHFRKPAARRPRQALLALACLSALSMQAASAMGATGQADAAAASPQRVLVQADRLPGSLLTPRANGLEPGNSTVSLLEYGAQQLHAPGKASLAALLATAPSVGENFAAVGYYENFTVRGFTLDLGSAFRVNGMAVPGEWQFPLEGTAALQVLAGAAGSRGGLVGAGGSLNQTTPRGQQPLRARLEADAQGGTLLVAEAGQAGPAGAWRATASRARLRPGIAGADGQRSFVGLAFDTTPLEGLRLYVDVALQHRAQPVVPGFQLLGGTTPPDLQRVREVNLNAQPWSRPFTNQGRLAILRVEGDGPGGMKWEAALSSAQARIDDNLATPFGCNEPPFEFFCANGDYVLYDYRALERRASTHARVSAVQTFRAAGLQHELQVGVERIERRLRQSGYFNVTSYDAAGRSLSGNVYRPGEALPQPFAPGVDRPPLDSAQQAMWLGHTATMGPWTSVLGLRWTDIEAPAGQPGERRLLPRWALSWQPGPALTAFASLAQGLEFGSEAPATAVNAGEVLAPRVTRQVEVGGKGSAGAAFSYSLTAFRAQRLWEFVEPLGSSWAGKGAWVQRGKQTHTGIEAGFQWAPGPATQLDARYTFIDATGRGSGLAGRDGQQLQNIPRSALYVRLDHRLQCLPSLRYNAAVTARSSKAATADGAVRVGGHAVIDLGLTWQLSSSGPPVSLDIGVRNAADRRYWRDSGQAYSADLLFPGAARAWAVSLQVGGFE